MLESLRLYYRYILSALRAQMQYRASFFLLSIGQFIGTGIEFLGIWALFARFGSLKGWTLAEVALLYGMVNIAFALAEMFGRGFEMFSTMVKAGDFDRLLLRPRSTILQMAGQEFHFLRTGRLIQGIVVLSWAASQIGVVWTLPKALLLAASILGGACTFYGLLILQATLCFWTVESLEIMNTVTYGGTETAQYPITIYRPWFRWIFTFIIPLACVNYIPVSALLERGEALGVPPLLPWFAPLVGVAFLLVCARFWQFGERRYRSTGS
jgi:ABC-2 type transport system permease protein